MIFKISKLKIIEIRQRNAFSIKNGMFLINYIANLNFPGIPGKLKLSGKFPTLMLSPFANFFARGMFDLLPFYFLSGWCAEEKFC